MKKQIVSIAVIILSITLLLSACSSEPKIVKDSSQKSTENSESSEKTKDSNSSKEEASSAEKEGKVESEAEQSKTEDDVKTDEDFVGTLEEIKSETEGEPSKIKAADFSLVDQNSVRHKLSDYKGKVIILNFWQTWCPPCRAEMPDFQKYYEEHGENQEEVVMIGVASPKNPMQIYRDEKMTDNEIADFLKDGGFTYPSLMDYKGDLYRTYQVNAFPSTFFIDKEGYVIGKTPGALSFEQLSKIVDDVLDE